MPNSFQESLGLSQNFDLLLRAKMNSESVSILLQIAQCVLQRFILQDPEPGDEDEDDKKDKKDKNQGQDPNKARKESKAKDEQGLKQN